MKKLLQLFMVLALLVVPSMCFAQKTFPDGTVLNDKEELVYDLVERTSKNFADPSSIRFKKIIWMTDDWIEKYKNGEVGLSIGLSIKNELGGRSIKTYEWTKYGKLKYEYDGVLADSADKDVDITKLNHLWKTYHAEDD